MHKKTTPILAATLAWSGLLAASARAQSTIIEWGAGDTSYVTSNQALNGWSSSGRTFSTSSELSPLSNYTIPASLSGAFYGGAVIYSPTSVGTASFTGGSVANNASGDRISTTFSFSGTTANSDQIAYEVVVFGKTDFLNYSSDLVSLSGSDSYSLTAAGSTSFGGSSNARIVVHDNGNWYISNAIFAGSKLNQGTLQTASDVFSSRTWYDYDPSSDLFTIGSGATPDLSDIDFVGYYLELRSLSSKNGVAGSLGVSNFLVTATGTAVPEPSTYAAVLGVAALLVALKRRSRAGA